MYDRQLLLGTKRNAILELWEVRCYGRDSYGDPDYVSVYGMRPADWYAQGVRLLGRTAVECTRDKLGDAIGREIATIAATVPKTGRTLLIDPFAGSGNTLYWILRHLPAARGLGFELDPMVFELTHRNFAALNLPIEILNTDYISGLTMVSVPPDEILIAFIAPPWGEALSNTTGLNLQRTMPPVAEIVDALVGRFPTNMLLFAIQTYELMDAQALVFVRERFDWSTTALYRLNAHGQNHGVLLGAKRWTP